MPGALAIALMAVALGGCATAGHHTVAGSNNASSVFATGDTITIGGTRAFAGADQNSTGFGLKEGAYLLTWANANGSPGLFTSTLESDDGRRGIALVSIKEPSGSSVLVVGSPITPAGSYRLIVQNGGTYVVSISKPASGEIAPITLKGDKGRSIAKAVVLKPGAVKIGVRHDADPMDATTVELFALDGTGIVLDQVAGMAADKRGEIVTAGIYLFGVTFSGSSGGEATISQ